METPQQRFTRLAEARINKVLDGYRLLANLRGSNYKSTTEQRAKMFRTLREGLDEVEMALAGEKVNKAKFKFNSDGK